MVKSNIILIIGQNKCNKLFEKSIEIYLSRNDITDIILVTYKNENIEFVKSNTSVKKILVPNKKFKLSAEYQKYLYDIGIKFIGDNYKEENLFILKTRMDVCITKNQLDYVFSQNYKINLQNNDSLDISTCTLFPHKVWVPWVHITNPFYIEDACFYSHISIMRNLSPYIGNLFQHQGHSHVRWFLLLAREYNLYEEANTYNDYKNMNSKFILNEITKNILIKYGECIRKQFIVKTLDGGIIFRRWNDINFYKKPSNNIVDIIDNKAISNLKIVYNNEDYYLIDLEA